MVHPRDSKDAASRSAASFPRLLSCLESKWPDNSVINLVYHGHSVPAGYFDTPNVRTFDAYPHLFHLELKSRFPHAVINTIVTAIGGEISPRGVKRTDEVLAHRPDLVIIDSRLTRSVMWPLVAESGRARRLVFRGFGGGGPRFAGWA
jgi:hypothetical protein